MPSFKSDDRREVMRRALIFSRDEATDSCRARDADMARSSISPPQSAPRVSAIFVSELFRIRPRLCLLSDEPAAAHNGSVAAFELLAALQRR